MAKIFESVIERYLKGNKPVIAFGLVEPDPAILASLERAKSWATIQLVQPAGSQLTDQFESIVSDQPEEELVNLLIERRVDGIIRGTLDDFKVQEAYIAKTGEKSALIYPVLARDPLGREFLLAYPTNLQGWDKDDRLRHGLMLGRYLKDLDIEPVIAVFAAVRSGTYERKKGSSSQIEQQLNQTHDDAEWLADQLTHHGFAAKNWDIDLNKAVEADATILLPVNGMVSNQIFRVIMFCGGQLLAGPRIGASLPYEDNSRTEKDFENHIQWLVATIHRRQEQGAKNG